MQVTITKISRKDRVSKAGKPFVSLGIMTKQHEERWLSGFDGPETKDWKIGDTVEIDVAEKGEYLNFTLPKKAPQTESRAVNMIEFKVIPLLQAILARLPDLKNGDYPPMTGQNDASGFDDNIENPF